MIETHVSKPQNREYIGNAGKDDYSQIFGDVHHTFTPHLQRHASQNLESGNTQ